jgi:hypothetical protein
MSAGLESRLPSFPRKAESIKQRDPVARKQLMSAPISLITLGVADVARATSFYEPLGFVRSKSASQAAIR